MCAYVSNQRITVCALLWTLLVHFFSKFHSVAILCLCCTLLKLQFSCVVLFSVLHFFLIALFSCFTLPFSFHVFFLLLFFMLHIFLVALFSCCAFFMLHSFHFALLPCCTLFIILLLPCFHLNISCYLHFFVLHPFHVGFFSCCIIFMLHSFHVALFPCCTIFMLLLFRVAPSLEISIFHGNETVGSVLNRFREPILKMGSTKKVSYYPQSSQAKLSPSLCRFSHRQNYYQGPSQGTSAAALVCIFSRNFNGN